MLCYQAPKRELTVASRADTAELITEFRMFEILDKLHNTATGVWNGLAAGMVLASRAPVFCGPLARLFNMSIGETIAILLPFSSNGSWHLLHLFPRPLRHRNTLTFDLFLSLPS